MDTTEIDITKLKYVLYARKSTDDPKKQVRSIDDQIAECQQLALRLGIHIEGKPLREEKSAKRPNRRPIFRQMLSDLKSGKYDGILAWHPDRLARNMREGGEIIDMIDEGQIKDLKFITHHFTNDPNGKMMLGLAFVLSKQYSDDLSQKVTRGVRRSFGEGKSPAPKHGYCRDEAGYYQPDGKNFDLICEAWQKRKEGISLEEISNYMNNQGYGRIIKSTGRRVRMDKRILSDIFRDPFYYGILVQVNQPVDLRTIYNFHYAITEEDYMAVQQLSYRRIQPSKSQKIAFYPLKTMIICTFCGSNCYVGPSQGGSGKRYLNYRCDNENCTRKKRSIRAKVVFDFIYQFLEKGLNLTENDYKNYYKGITAISDNKRQKIRVEIHSKEAVLKKTNSDIKEISLKVLDYDRKSPIRKANEDTVDELQLQKIKLESEIEKLKSKVTDPEKDKLSIEQFLNLSKNAATIVQSANAVVKDQICRIIFLNFSIDEEKVASYQLKEPFATLLKHHQIVSSRGYPI